MSSERPYKRHRIDEVAPAFKRKLSHLSGPPTALSMDVDLGPDNQMATTDAGTR